MSTKPKTQESPKPSATTAWTRKDLIAIRDLSKEELTLVLDTAAAFKQVGGTSGGSWGNTANLASSAMK